MLQAHPVGDCPEVVAQVDVARGLDAGKQDLHAFLPPATLYSRALRPVNDGAVRDGRDHCFRAFAREKHFTCFARAPSVN